MLLVRPVLAKIEALWTISRSFKVFELKLLNRILTPARNVIVAPSADSVPVKFGPLIMMTLNHH